MGVAEIMREKLTVPYSDEQNKDKSSKKLGKRQGKFKVCCGLPYFNFVYQLFNSRIK